MLEGILHFVLACLANGNCHFLSRVKPLSSQRMLIEINHNLNYAYVGNRYHCCRLHGYWKSLTDSHYLKIFKRKLLLSADK
jgi:hypothetical protein